MPLDIKFPLAPLLALLVAGCGGGEGGDGGGSTSGLADGQQPLSDPLAVPDALLVIQGDPSRINAVPDVVAVETLADSGLQVAYTAGVRREHAAPRYIGAQWQHMQSCVGIVAPAPLVIVVAGTIEPLIATDDVLRDIEGRITASASVGADGIATLQVLEADFDGSLGNPGFGLRSIMGRHLWLSAMLPERDYPFECARTPAPATSAPRDLPDPLAARRSAVPPVGSVTRGIPAGHASLPAPVSVAATPRDPLVSSVASPFATRSVLR